jgi:hypothetical protein
MGVKNTLRRLKEKQEMIDNLKEDIIELRADLAGMELEYMGEYACIDEVNLEDEEVLLYTEDEAGKQGWAWITFKELEELI